MKNNFGNGAAHSADVCVDALASINECHWKSRKEITFTWIGILFTLVATILITFEQGPVLIDQFHQNQWQSFANHFIFLFIAALLIYGGLVYLFSRLGYIHRLRVHMPASSEDLDILLCNEQAPELTVLVPSYKEDRSVIYQTLMSAALQEYPCRRVVLLIDDIPNPTSIADMTQLASARELPQHIDSFLAPIAKHMANARNGFLQLVQHNAVDAFQATKELIELWHHAAYWFCSRATEHGTGDHAERLFVEQVLRVREANCMNRAQQLAEWLEVRKVLSIQLLENDFRKLGSMFDCQLTSFERKRYVNLSHEPNKAMNLNSYIHLTGKHFNEQLTADGWRLDEVEPENATFSVPLARYFVTLDADSILLPEYALRLIHIMQLPGNERLAVAQTPYSAFPGATSTLERIAGATTDLQYIIHQGFTRHNATYWVGANALLRREALNAIAEDDLERGYKITRYIQDRTVIEDTESSVDLAARGWTLYNYPQRLAYSATPADFGSLLIQRRRWANGGLIILPKLLGYLIRQPHRKIAEGLLRLHYLVSIAAVNVGLLLMMSLPFSDSITTVWLPLTALPYYLLYGRDLMLCGYRASDLLRVYALNLLLIPVNLGGVLKSLQQAVTGQQIPFGRTPKIKGRTATAPLYIIAIFAILAQWLYSAHGKYDIGHYNQGVFALLNAAILFYAIFIFIGLRDSWGDLAISFRKSDPLPELIADDLISETDNVAVLNMKINQRLNENDALSEKQERRIN
ncbi:glycosyltransferase family 2 protein [Sulfurirhabdus autotrophica]|uniref:Glycosyl transferase family 2 n=1 Tax=Sulfurirhabdus autotrophica TaxID=1706046 RepID=A0A4R3YHZ2_9PROT|nr:glycosyltransferase family 2 protein [Sulfurirhabdus autotrophica]TCV90243.1 glycosyl transferase family 2 [Sulfurirhabdus autotrophica]